MLRNVNSTIAALAAAATTTVARITDQHFAMMNAETAVTHGKQNGEFFQVFANRRAGQYTLFLHSIFLQEFADRKTRLA